MQNYSNCLINTQPNMLLPQIINQNTLNAFRNTSDEFFFANQPKTLRDLSIEVIAKNFAEHPIIEDLVLSEDRYHLLNILPSDLPLSLTVCKISDNVYWKKAYQEKWPKKLPLDVLPVEMFSSNQNGATTNGHCRSWKGAFIEMYLTEYLEQLKPEDYNAENMKELADLCRPYVQILSINQMQASANSCNRIPLNSILASFENLVELSICFKQTYSVDNQFSWNVLKTSLQDIKLLAKGLEKLRLETLRLKNSDINCAKLQTLLLSLEKHKDLKILDLSHCKIAKPGMEALSKFLLEVPLQHLILTNNRIGPDALQEFSQALADESCKLLYLDLRLNTILDAGGLQVLSSSRNLKELFLGGCGLSGNIRFNEVLRENKSLELLNISNNNIGEIVGLDILDGLNYNRQLINLDVRMCRISSMTEWKIQEKIGENKKWSKKILN